MLNVDEQMSRLKPSQPRLRMIAKQNYICSIVAFALCSFLIKVSIYFAAH